MLETLKSNDSALNFRTKISNNFSTLGQNLSSQMLSLTSNEMYTLSYEYLREGLRIFNIDTGCFFKYTNGSWREDAKSSSPYVIEFTPDSWDDGNNLYIPYSIHNISNPLAQIYRRSGSDFISVEVEILVSENFDIKIKSDIAFDGKLVIK